MPKTTFLATAPDGSIHTRTSENRRYTHTVVARRNYADALAHADRLIDADGDNFRFWSAIIAAGGYYARRKLPRPARYTEEQFAAHEAKEVADAKERIGGAPTETIYKVMKRDQRLADLAERKANGAFEVYFNCGWCGRLDLAQKLAASEQAKGYLDVTILEARVK